MGAEVHSAFNRVTTFKAYFKEKLLKYELFILLIYEISKYSQKKLIICKCLCIDKLMWNKNVND